jgi:hypothetical protein
MSLRPRHVLEFLVEMWSDFAGLVSGGLSFLFALAAFYYQVISDHPKPVLWILAVFCYLVASFNVWYKIHPELNIEVRDVLLDKNYEEPYEQTSYPPLQQFVTFMLYLVNTRQENNAIKSYDLTINVNDQKLAGQLITSHALIRRGVRRDHIDLDTIKGSKLQPASPVEGWARFMFEGGPSLNNRAYLLTVTDVYNIRYKIKGRLPEYSDEIVRKIPDAAFRLH